MNNIKNLDLYLERMSKPLQEKLTIARFIPENAKNILDVGCADGTVTAALAEIFPAKTFVGLDINSEFIALATGKHAKIKNLSFENIYLRERLNNPEKFDVVIFCSVLHEFYSYGEGISTVVKALSDAREILAPSGTLIIRDMILYEYSATSDLWLEKLVAKVKSKSEILPLLNSFESIYGTINSVKKLNHFILKYLYGDNWEMESKENYVETSFEKYDQILKLLDMKIQYQRSSTIPFLKEKWKTDFGFSDEEINGFRSTGIIVAKKLAPRI